MDISNKLEIARKFIETSKKNLCFIVADSLVSQCIAEDMKDSYQVVDLAEDFTPFKPFLNLLSNGNLPEKNVREKTYSIQTESFVSFFKTGMAEERYDIPIDNEELYEINQYVKSIVELFKQLPVKNYIFTNAQNIFSDSFAVIKELEKHELSSKFVLPCAFLPTIKFKPFLPKKRKDFCLFFSMPLIQLQLLLELLLEALLQFHL